ncbi:MAG: hypothetical protein MJ126_09545 [Lachnospiraceae bacterium]|nr:hypothetical protein [Lachnospiraceae bacterium]
MKNRKINIVMILAVCVLLICTSLVCVLCTRKMINDKTIENMTFNSVSNPVEVRIGDKSIADYVIVYEAGNRRAATDLRDYIYGISGKKLRISMIKPSDCYIKLDVNKSLEKTEIKDGNIVISAKSQASLLKQVKIFANSYLGYAFAGESREHILENTDYINIPANKEWVDEPWMEQREPIICLWKTNAVRGIYQNPNVSLKSELMSYSDDQLYNYVKMMKYCGFNGIQVTDMCSTWAQYGGYEFVQQRIRFMADAAHSLDMKFTLWVWGSEFTGYGWTDDSVVYNGDGMWARENPKVQASFDKYYDIYARLADCSDRVIMHFNDPGNLSDSSDIGYYAARFKEKCIEKNPDIDFGVSCYTYQIDLGALKEYIDGDFTVYSGTSKSDADFEAVGKFREYAKNNELAMGVWSWNLCEMEIDQLAEMNVNAKIIADVYGRNSLLDDRYKPEYWSEMDSYHMVNVFSLYCAGQMLNSPDKNPDEVLMEICDGVVGEEYSKELFEILDIIQDARSGESFEEFKNGYDEHILMSEAYPAKEIADRCDAAIPILDEMIDANIETNSIPLSISVTELLSMIRPHLEEIKEFAEFRMMLDEAEKMLADKKSTDEISRFINTNYVSVKEYNTVVGSWGSAEGFAQYSLMEDYCDRAGIAVPHDPVFDYYRKQRIYGEMITFQKKSDTCVKYEKGKAFQFGLAFSETDTERLVDEMLEDGILKSDYTGKVYLTDWENYRYDF